MREPAPTCGNVSQLSVAFFYGHHLYVGVGRGLDRRFPKIPKIQLFRVRSTSTKCDEDTYLRCCSIPAPPSLSRSLSPLAFPLSPLHFRPGDLARAPKDRKIILRHGSCCLAPPRPRKTLRLVLPQTARQRPAHAHRVRMLATGLTRMWHETKERAGPLDACPLADV